jgi:hypothetical protein
LATPSASSRSDPNDSNQASDEQEQTLRRTKLSNVYDGQQIDADSPLRG